MSITRSPTAEELYSRDAPKRALDRALAEARDLAHWAGRRIPNGPTSGFMTQGYVIGHTGDLDLAIAQIIARVREDMAYERASGQPSRARRKSAQLAVRMTGECDNCGTEFVSGRPGLRAGPAKRTPKQWAAAFKSIGDSVQPARVRRSAAAKEKIPNHKRSPTGKHPKSSKGKSK